nr:hypothetical protein [Noviherbaspirillum saxi]
MVTRWIHAPLCSAEAWRDEDGRDRNGTEFLGALLLMAKAQCASASRRKKKGVVNSVKADCRIYRLMPLVKVVEEQEREDDSGGKCDALMDHMHRAKQQRSDAVCNADFSRQGARMETACRSKMEYQCMTIYWNNRNSPPENSMPQRL